MELDSANAARQRTRTSAEKKAEVQWKRTETQPKTLNPNFMEGPYPFIVHPRSTNV
eukprot:COSAG06_NODE_55803_length_288_cov_0.412698_1_plen_55_part_10